MKAEFLIALSRSVNWDALDHHVLLKQAPHTYLTKVPHSWVVKATHEWGTSVTHEWVPLERYNREYLHHSIPAPYVG